MEQKPVAWLRYLMDTLSVALVISLIVYGINVFEEKAKWGIFFLAAAMVITALGALPGMGGKRFWNLKGTANSMVVAAVILLALVTGYYFHSEYVALNFERAGANTQIDYLMGIVVILLSLFLTWKDQGYAIPMVSLVFIVYMFLGPHLPGIFFHGGMGLERILEELAVSIGGVYGLINQVGATWIAIFFLFAGFLGSFGTLQYVLKLSHRLVGGSVDRLPQIAVIGSMIFGSFSGSVAANVAGTGSFTIPLMKSTGFPPAKAGAVEAVASSAGQVMPPVMGASAFLMCTFLNVSYWHIVSVAFLPAIIFFLSLSASVLVIAKQIYVRKQPVSREFTSGDFKAREGIPFFLSMAVFLFSVGYYMIDVMLGGVILVLTFLGSHLVLALISNRDKKLALLVFSRNLVEGCRKSAILCGSLGPLLAVLGIAVRGLISTGLSQRLAFGMVDLAGGHMLVLLFLIMLMSIVFGMAVSTVACYLVVVLLAAPSLEQMGVAPVVSHFTVFYFAMLAAITPPVAVGAAVAAGIAGSGFFKTSWEAMKLGAALFLLPFGFVFHPAVLVGGFWSKAFAGIILLVSMLLITTSMQLHTKGIGKHALRFAMGLAGLALLFIPF